MQDNLYELFDSLIDTESDLISNADKINEESNTLIDINNSDEKKNKKKPKSKSNKPKIFRLGNASGFYNLSSLHNSIIDNADVLVLNIGNFSRVLIDSWPELLLFLIGTASNKYGDLFESKAATAGVFNKSVKLSKSDLVHSDSELGSDITIYKIPTLPNNTIEVIWDTNDIYDGLVGIVSLLGFKPKDIKLVLISKLLPREDYEAEKLKILAKENKSQRQGQKTKSNQTKSNQPKSNQTKSNQTKSNQLKTIQKAINDMQNISEYEHATVLELHEHNQINKIKIVGYKIFGEYERRTSSNAEFGASLFTMIYLSTVDNPKFSQEIKQALIDNTIIDEVGVTEDNLEYLGIMQPIKIEGTNLYFYTNNSIKTLVDFICNVFNSLGIIDVELSIYYVIQ